MDLVQSSHLWRRRVQTSHSRFKLIDLYFDTTLDSMLSFSSHQDQAADEIAAPFYDGMETEHMQDEVPFTSSISLKADQKAAGSVPAPPPPPRQRIYFLIRTNSLHNLHISQKEGAWCTQRFNEPKLDDAFGRGGSEVRLLFSVTGEDHEPSPPPLSRPPSHS